MELIKRINKKKYRLLTFVGVIICCLIFMFGCNNELAKPSKLKVAQDTLTLTWEKVEDADGYIIKINDQEIESRKNVYELEELAPGTYEIYIKARGDGENHSDSDWSNKLSFVREDEAPLYYKAINNATAYEVAGIGDDSGDIVVDTIYRGKPVIAIGDAAFANSVKVKSLTLPDSIVKIGKRAFFNCSYMESVNIPAGVTAIGERAFQGCRALKSLTIPEAITEIGEYMFSYCRELETLNLGSKITSVGNNAFADCEKLKKIEFSNTLTTIGDFAFSSCLAAETIEIGDNVTSVGARAFYKCESLTELPLSANLETIGEYAFGYCLGLTSVTIPEKVEALPKYVFYGCTNLATIDLNDNLTAIGAFAFYDTKLWKDATSIVYADGWLLDVKEEANAQKEYEIANTTVGIAAEAFYGCQGFDTLELPNSVKYIGAKAFYNCEINLAFIGDKATVGENEGVVCIGEYAFAYCDKLNGVELNSTQLEKVEAYAFVGCKKLSKLDLPNTVNQIGTYAFYDTKMWNDATDLVYVDDWLVGCNNAQSYVGGRVKSGIKGIADYAFYACVYMQAITLPDTLVYLGEAAFYQCMSLIDVTIPAGVTEIGDYTFFRCFFLEAITFANESKVEKIGRSAFYQCEMLGGISVPASVKEIEDYAFYGCKMLKDLTFNVEVVDNSLVGVKTLGKRAFQECLSIETLELPDTITLIGSHAFYKCAGIKTLSLGAGITSIDAYTFYECLALETLTIPENITYIGKNAFKNCKALTTLDFGSSITTVDDYAFFACGLTSLHIPASLTTVGNYAFRNNTALTSVILPSTLDNLGKHALYGAQNLTIYCEDTARPTIWPETWNSSFRPVVWGVKLSADKTYVESFTVTETTIDNPKALNGMTGPIRNGYTFGGWATQPGSTTVAYTANNVYTAPVGTTLYAIWE